MLALLVTGLTVALLFGRRDASPGVGPGLATDVGAQAPEAARGVEPEPVAPGRGPRTWVLEMGSGGGASEPATPPARDPASEWSSDPALLGELPSGSGRIVFAVQDASGRALRDVAVLLKSLGTAGGAELAVTGAGGEARFLDLAPGPYAYRVQAPSGPEVASADSVRLEEGEWKDLTVRLLAVGLAVSGRVLDPRGGPIAGIEVSARRHHFASAVSESVSGDRSPRTTRSQDDGSFEIRGLPEGEYDVETRATHRFAPAKVIVRAGGAPVDLVLREGFRVYGTVTNARGEALARVHVAAQGATSAGAYTDERGSYELQLERADGDAAYTFRFTLRGYEVAQPPLPQLGPEATRELRLDVELGALENAALVTGVVESERGEPVAGATIFLKRPQGMHYQATSGADGSFSLADVEFGADYQLSLVAPVPFRDYAEQGIRVTENGLSLEIVLESLATGRLTGRMVDVEGSPLPGFRLWLGGASVRSAVPVSGDERGYFELEEAPAGSLSFDTRASPRLRISGPTLRAGGEAEVLLVLDSGDQEMAGEVLDDRGDPVAGAQVSLSWSHASGGLRSTSQRTTSTGPSGVFRFSQLGPGEHLLEVRAAGYRPVQEYRDADRYAAELEVRLDPNAP